MPSFLSCAKRPIESLNNLTFETRKTILPKQVFVILRWGKEFGKGNANAVAVWKTGNVKELDLLATELSGQIPKKDILDAYEYAMNKEPGNRHNFLFIDLTPKKDHPSPFRFNYNEWILPS